MPKRTILQDKMKRTSVNIPAYIRDKFDLKKGTVVDVTDNENSIIITPIREQ
jgi:AbrB family looped-hinge helix DNA binding protein